MNKSIVTFTRGTLAQATPLWQYDYGQILEINGLDLPATYQVHFCNCSDSQTITVLGNADGVLIPDNLLQTGKTVIAYIYLHTGADDGETEYKITIPVRSRPAPSDIPPTPEQQSALDEAIAALNSAVEDVEDIADGIPDQINAALAEAKASGEFDGPPGPQGAQGPQGESGTPGNSIWSGGAVRASGTTPYYFLSDLSGRTDIAPAAGDLIVSNIFWLWQIKRIVGQTVYLNSLGSIKGETGANGEDGYSPTVTVTEISGGHRVTITDAAGDHVFDVLDGQGGGGTSDYDDLTDKPQINSVTLSGNKSAADLGLAPAGAYVKPSGGIPASDLASGVIPTVPVQSVNGQTGAVVLSASDVGAGTYSKPSGGIPKTDLASAVQTSLGKADTALQSAPVTSVNGQTGAVSLTIPSTAGDVGAIAAPDGGSVGQVLKKTASGAEWANESGGGGGLSAAVKAALIQIAKKVAYIDDQGQTYFEDLRDALYTLNSISAAYTQGSVVYTNTPLDDLKADLVVTANYIDSYTEPVPASAYTLSGTLVAGTSTVTVSYSGKTATFEVQVTQYRQPLHAWDFTQSLIDSVGDLEIVLSNSNGGESLPTRDSSGLHFTAGEQIAATPAISAGYANGYLYEFDISSAVFAGDTSKHKRLFNISNDNLLIFRNAGALQMYKGAWLTFTAEPGQIIPTTLDALSGKTVGLKLGTDKTAYLYIGGVLIGTKANWTAVNYTGNYQFRFGGTASGTAAQGNDIHNLTLTGFRIYQEE